MARPSTDSAPRDATSQALLAFAHARRDGDEDLMRRRWRELLGTEWSRIRLLAATRRHEALDGGRLTEEQVDELAQRVVERLLERIQFRGSSIGELHNFLRTATEFEFRDLVREHVADDQGRGGSLDEPGADGSAIGVTARRAERASIGRVLDDLERWELRRAIEEGFAQVDDDKRDIVRAMLAGTPAAELAERHGISVANVYQRNKRGLGQLRAFLQDHR